MNDIQVRFANEKDAEGILRAHYSAVNVTALQDYPRSITSEWSAPVTSDRINKYLSDSFLTETTLVALIGDVIVGFGSIVEANNELRAVYVSADFGRRGVGSALLCELERIAVERGCKILEMDSSLTAANFYRKHGFEELERGVHVLRSGGKMDCVKMRKSLCYVNC